MTEEEKARLEAEKAKEEAEAKAAAESKAKDDETTDGDQEDESEESNKIDYEAELQKEREARKKAEEILADKRFKEAEKKRKQQENEEDEEGEEKPLTSKELEAILAREREATRKEMLIAEADRIASTLTSNENEKHLVLELHKTRSFPSYLSLEEQIEECFAIANRKKLIGERNEALRALKNKADNNSATTHHDGQAGGQPKIAQSDASEYARLGFKWNATAKRYEKKLSNGQLLVKDLKSGKTQLVKA